MEAPVLRVEGLQQYFPAGKGSFVRAVDGVSFDIWENEILGIVGESGSGKSTIAYTVVGMYKPTEGRILFKGQDIGREARHRTLRQKGQMQIVFQDPGSSLNPHRTVGQILDLPLSLHNKLKSRNDRRKRAAELLDLVGLSEDYLDKHPPGMGGGERQLIAIARALATNPELVLFDEPTSALDVSVQAKVIRRLLTLHQDMKLTYMFITHDLSLMRNVANRVAIMYLGAMCEVAPTVVFFSSPLHPYTHMLLSSIPVVSEEEEALKPKRVVSRGEIPSPVNIPPGCRFHTRCPESAPICRTTIPVLCEVGEHHWVACHAASKG